MDKGMCSDYCISSSGSKLRKKVTDLKNPELLPIFAITDIVE